MSNDKAAATWHPDAAQVVHVAADGTETPATPDADGFYTLTVEGDGPPAEDVIEPMCVADLRDLIAETAEALDTLVEHAMALREDNRDVPEGNDLAWVVNHLSAAWAACRTAQTDAQRIAAVLP